MNDSPSATSQERSMARAAASVSIATIISRILGVGREMVMAKYFGAGRITDAFNVAYRIPNLLRDLFAEGALSSAFVPTFTRELTRKGGSQAWLLANLVINALAVVLGATTLVTYFGARWFVLLQAWEFQKIPGKLELTAQMVQIMSPFLLFVALAALMMGMLNACGSFFAPAMAPSAFNICCIFAGIFLSPVMPRYHLDPIVSMAIGALVGGASQFFVQVPYAYRHGFRYHWVLDFKDPGLRQIAKLMLPGIVGLSATQINITVDNQIASFYGNGPISWLNYAFRLMQLPIGVFGVAIATATLATVSRQAAQNAYDKMLQTVSSSLRLAACLTFPSTAGLIVFRKEIVQLLYERDKFSAFDTLQTSKVLVLYALALFAYSAVKILVPVFYSLSDTRTPVRTSMTTIAVKIGVNFLFIIPFGFLGLALATAIASWLNFVLLMHALYKRLESRWELQELWMYLRIALASASVALAALATYSATSVFVPIRGTLSLGLNLGMAIVVGATATVPSLRILRIPEAMVLTRLLRFRLGMSD